MTVTFAQRHGKLIVLPDALGCVSVELRRVGSEPQRTLPLRIFSPDPSPAAVSAVVGFRLEVLP